jgi:hypothetical protein
LKSYDPLIGSLRGSEHKKVCKGHPLAKYTQQKAGWNMGTAEYRVKRFVRIQQRKKVNTGKDRQDEKKKGDTKK